jgi:hypothetical protein
MRAGRIVLLVFGVLVAAGCGSDDGGGGLGLDVDDTPADTGDLGTDDTFSTPGGGEIEFEEAPGQMRFLSLLSENGEPIELDIYWGGPDAIEETEPVATIEYGEASEYLAPMVALDPLFPSEDISFTAVMAGADEVVFTWNRLLPDDVVRLVVLFRPDPGTEVNMTDLDEAQPMFTEFAEPPAGQVAINYQQWGTSLDPTTPGGTSLGMQSGGRCLSVGANVVDEDGYTLPGDVLTINVDPGAEIALGDTELALDPDEAEPHWECNGAPVSDSVTVPDSGRAFVIATTGPSGDPELVVVPVDS